MLLFILNEFSLVITDALSFHFSLENNFFFLTLDCFFVAFLQLEALSELYAVILLLPSFSYLSVHLIEAESLRLSPF